MLTTFDATVMDWVIWFEINYGAFVIGLGAAAFLIAHLFQKEKGTEIALSKFMVVATTIIFVILALVPTEISIGLMISLVLMYGIGSFVVLSAYMLGGLAERLTKWRGEKWVKELDYVYLTFGLGGNNRDGEPIAVCYWKDCYRRLIGAVAADDSRGHSIYKNQSRYCRVEQTRRESNSPGLSYPHEGRRCCGFLVALPRQEPLNPPPPRSSHATPLVPVCAR